VRRFLPRYWTRNYATGPIAQRVARMIIECEEVEYIHTGDHYYSFIRCGDLIVKFWDQNRPHAWFMEGSVSKRNDGPTLYWWKGQMPDRATLPLLEDAIDRAVEVSMRAAISKAGGANATD